MSFQAYIDNVQAKTGNTPDDFRALATEQGLTKFGEIVAWLKAEFGLGHGHANAIAQLLVNADKFKASPDDKLATHFTGGKAKWRPVYDGLTAEIKTFGDDITFSPNRTYVNVKRGGKKFAILQVSTEERFDIGIKLKESAPTGRFEAAGSWNNMLTHRVRISHPEEVDAEVLTWLKQAYEATGL
jgi:hypothetical protein